MCGIVGFLDKRPGSKHDTLGLTLLKMLEALACRGPDSAGVALFGPSANGSFVVRVKLGDRGNLDERAHKLASSLKSFGVEERQLSRVSAYARFVVDSRIQLSELIDSIEGLDPEIEVVSVGRSLEIVKQVGSPANLETTFAISRQGGSHGLGHTRLST